MQLFNEKIELSDGNVYNFDNSNLFNYSSTVNINDLEDIKHYINNHFTYGRYENNFANNVKLHTVRFGNKENKIIAYNIINDYSLWEDFMLIFGNEIIKDFENITEHFIKFDGRNGGYLTIPNCNINKIDFESEEELIYYAKLLLFFDFTCSKLVGYFEDFCQFNVYSFDVLKEDAKKDIIKKLVKITEDDNKLPKFKSCYLQVITEGEEQKWDLIEDINLDNNGEDFDYENNYIPAGLTNTETTINILKFIANNLDYITVLKDNRKY